MKIAIFRNGSNNAVYLDGRLAYTTTYKVDLDSVIKMYEITGDIQVSYDNVSNYPDGFQNAIDESVLSYSPLSSNQLSSNAAHTSDVVPAQSNTTDVGKLQIFEDPTLKFANKFGDENTEIVNEFDAFANGVPVDGDVAIIKPGDNVYLESDRTLLHGITFGGAATVSEVRTVTVNSFEQHSPEDSDFDNFDEDDDGESYFTDETDEPVNEVDYYFTVLEVPGKVFSWNLLKDKQAELQAAHGVNRAFSM